MRKFSTMLISIMTQQKANQHNVIQHNDPQSDKTQQNHKYSKTSFFVQIKFLLRIKWNTHTNYNS
jgi:hypothetical protein